MTEIRIFGIRHHGPGSARSLADALAALQPDCLLIEGPPDADVLIPLAAGEGMNPPVALPVYRTDQPRDCAFFPFAGFSPEWVAIRHALEREVPVRFIDLPHAIQLADDVFSDKPQKQARKNLPLRSTQAHGRPPNHTLEATFERICMDRRHKHLQLVEFASTESRAFAEWSMAAIIPSGDLVGPAVALDVLNGSQVDLTCTAAAVQLLRTMALAGSPSSSAAAGPLGTMPAQAAARS